jgi:hypothetical protein
VRVPGRDSGHWPLADHQENIEWRSPAWTADYEAYDWWRQDRTWIALAGNGAAEYWHWVPELAVEGRVPIVFVWKDLNRAIIKAPDLGSFIFRSACQMLAACYVNDRDPSPEQRTTTIRADIPRLAELLRPEWQEGGHPDRRARNHGARDECWRTSPCVNRA